MSFNYIVEITEMVQGPAYGFNLFDGMRPATKLFCSRFIPDISLDNISRNVQRGGFTVNYNGLSFHILNPKIGITESHYDFSNNSHLDFIIQTSLILHSI